VGLRESKKLEMRQLIANKAMGLFVQRGFDQVTVAEVAAAAGVSEKTVFNYFPSKEDLFFDEVDAREAAIVDAIRNRKRGVSILQALQRLQLDSCARMCHPAFATFAAIIEGSPALQAKELEVMGRLTDTIAATIRSELGVPAIDAHVAANLLVGVHWQLFRIARAQALEGRHGDAALRRLRSDLKRAYRLLEHGLGGLERTDAPPGEAAPAA
jgi:AcrR family transcriptional regulator